MGFSEGSTEDRENSLETEQPQLGTENSCSGEKEITHSPHTQWHIGGEQLILEQRTELGSRRR